MSDANADAELAALRDSQRRYQAIFEHAVELIAVLEAVRSADGEVVDWRYQDANANALRLLGFELSQLRGRLLTEVLPAIAPRLIGVCRQVLHTGKPYRYESKVADRAFLVSFFPMGPEMVGTSSLDISARSRAEEQARRLSDANRAEKEWLSAVLDSMTEEVYFTDRQQRYTYANPAALREFGHDSVAGIEVDRIVRRIEVLRPDGSPRPIEEAPPLRALAGEVIRDEEQIVRSPRTHEWRYRQVSAAPVRDAAGQVIGSVSVVRDVTDERHAHAQLRERAARSAALLKLGDEFQAAPDPNGLVAAAARCLLEALDASRGEYCSVDGPEETLAASCGGDESQPPHGRSALQACTHVSELLQHAHAVVCTDVASDPRTAASAAALLDLGVAAFVAVAIANEARFAGVLWVTQNRPRRWSEDEVAFVHEVAERTRLAVEHRRSEQALRVREQQLREADRRKDEFLAVLAHELRNPLVPIRTGIELLKDAHLRPGLIDAVRPMMQRQVHHMVRLIDDLLDVSRITSGKIQLHRQFVTLGSVVESAIESNRSAIATGKLTLSVNLDQPQLLLSVDSTRFTQVIANLLQNAAKFTAPGGRISIDTAVLVTDDCVPPQRTLTVTVADTGTGIAAEFLPRVFDLFAQAQPAETQAGLGIGLTLARRLMELHGGNIEAHSDGLGRGSRFILRLPLPAQTQPQAAASAAAAAPLPKIRVLIIDDNQDAADVMALLIEQLGGHARVAYDGASGIEAVRAFGPQVVLLDLGMPGLNGYETCRRLRAQYGAGVAIAALSGWGQQQDKIQAAQAGFDAHLTKPATPDELRELLRSLGRGKQVQ
jgi:PAS domain S-box-containing protein